MRRVGDHTTCGQLRFYCKGKLSSIAPKIQYSSLVQNAKIFRHAKRSQGSEKKIIVTRIFLGNKPPVLCASAYQRMGFSSNLAHQIQLGPPHFTSASS
jgi:hypothetical protein